ncbi:MAG: hypothetical protein JJU12_03300 [Chlamydiales bacterium]|nr:hypothetical protein [Chlamydiales bacterium]
MFVTQKSGTEHLSLFPEEQKNFQKKLESNEASALKTWIIASAFLLLIGTLFAFGLEFGLLPFLETASAIYLGGIGIIGFSTFLGAIMGAHYCKMKHNKIVSEIPLVKEMQENQPSKIVK